MGKTSKRRPAAVKRETFDRSWERTFGPVVRGMEADGKMDDRPEGMGPNAIRNAAGDWYDPDQDPTGELIEELTAPYDDDWP